MPTLSNTIVQIDHLTDTLQSEMKRATAHREALQANQQEDDLPLHDAIVEKALRDTDLPGVMKAIERTFLEQEVPPELSRALTRLKRACKEAAASLSSAAPEQ